MSDTKKTARAKGEIAHGKRLSMGDAEMTWGWGTPAGKLRARRRADLIMEGAALGPGVRALEIGCGTGMFTGMFAASGAELLAVDISEDLLVKARERGIPRARFIAKRFEECDVDGPFDAVIGSSVRRAELPQPAGLPRAEASVHHAAVLVRLPRRDGVREVAACVGACARRVHRRLDRAVRLAPPVDARGAHRRGEGGRPGVRGVAAPLRVRRLAHHPRPSPGMKKGRPKSRPLLELRSVRPRYVGVS